MLVSIRTTPHQRLAELWADALRLEGLDAEVVPQRDGFAVMVEFEASERAAIVLADLDAEDPDAPPRDDEEEAPLRPPRPAPLPGWGRSWAGAVLAWALLAAYGILGAADPGARWTERGENDPTRLAAEPWRAITALTLHADLGHVVANAGAIFVFVTLAAWRLGPGVTVAVVLASGALGNILAGALYGSGVVSLGASTAVFGALGLLAALSLTDPARRRGVWVVLAASGALFGILGTSPGTDVLAHFMGFLAGLAVGIPVSLLLRTPAGRGPQAVLSAAAIVVVGLCWALALR
ncbi:MAG TPA: rhomboid family intramembrane serine protease [bacterium]|nr:rhomboid family intramembrane serine protease [bacterium]